MKTARDFATLITAGSIAAFLVLSFFAFSPAVQAETDCWCIKDATNECQHFGVGQVASASGETSFTCGECTDYCNRITTPRTWSAMNCDVRYFNHCTDTGSRCEPGRGSCPATTGGGSANACSCSGGSTTSQDSLGACCSFCREANVQYAGTNRSCPISSPPGGAPGAPAPAAGPGAAASAGSDRGDCVVSCAGAGCAIGAEGERQCTTASGAWTGTECAMSNITREACTNIDAGRNTNFAERADRQYTAVFAARTSGTTAGTPITPDGSGGGGGGSSGPIGGGGGPTSAPPPTPEDNVREGGFGIVPEACRGRASIAECGLPELVNLFVRIAQYIFGVSGAIALALFIYGGFLWITSAGNSERVQEGKKVITGAIVGLVIIFGAATIVRFLVETVRTGAGGTGTLAPLFEGESCNVGGERGINIRFDDGLRCVPLAPGSCEGRDYELQSIGFARTDSSTVTIDHECLGGMFPDEPTVQCCRLIGSAAPAPAAAESTAPTSAVPAPAADATPRSNQCGCPDGRALSATNGTECCSVCTSTTNATYEGRVVSCSASTAAGAPAETGTCLITCTGSACRTGTEARTNCERIPGTFEGGGCRIPTRRDECAIIDAGTDPRYADGPDRSISGTFRPS